MWGPVAVAALGGALLVWLVSPAGTGVTLFGPRWVAGGLVALALPVAVLAAVVALTVARPTRRTRWLVVLPVAGLAGGVGAIAAGSLFAAQVLGDAAAGMLLAVAAIAMYVLSQQVLGLGKEMR